jgi:hypothetical protein
VSCYAILVRWYISSLNIWVVNFLIK